MGNARLWAVLSLAAAVVVVTTAVEAAVVPGTNIEASVRPIVWTRYSGAPVPGGNNTVVAIWDTGDPWETMSRETAMYLGLPATTPLVPGGSGGNFRNVGTIAQQNTQSSGWFGARFDGPERTTPAPPGGWQDVDIRMGDPAHVFTSATVAPSNPVTSNGLYTWYGDYNNRFSETHTGMPFVTSSNAANNMTAYVDPINATPLPFAYDNTTGGNGRGLSGAGNPTDSRASSISFYNAGSSRIPTPAKNTNAGFAHFVTIQPQQFSSTLVPSNAQATINAALPAGVDRRITIEISPADAANGTVVVPFINSFPEVYYRVSNPAGTNAYAQISRLFEVRNETIRAGGEIDPRGFVRDDGMVQVQVVSKAGPATTVHLTQNIRLPSSAPRPYGTINIPGLVNTGANNILIDTGAPTTSASIIGTDTLNRFGQFWDFAPQNAGGGNNNGRLTLYAPSKADVISAVAKGMLIGVDGNTTGAAATAVRHEATIGSIPQLQPGIAATLSDGVDGNQSKAVFRTHLTASNATYIDEKAMKLDGAGKPNIISMSTGKDTVNTDLYFSINPQSQGVVGTDAGTQATRKQVGSDIFKASYQGRNPARVNGNNKLFINQETMGLGSFVGPGATADSLSGDNLSSLDMWTDAALPATSFSNLDSPILSHNDDGTGARPRVGGDRLGDGGNFDTYFTTDVPGPTAIYKSEFSVDGEWADYIQMGLIEGDIIDALALYRPSVSQGVRGHDFIDAGDLFLSPNLIDDDFRFDPNSGATFEGIDWNFGFDTDLAMFSLGLRSPTLAQYNLSPADLFISDFDGTFALAVSAESLGLQFFDDLDALDNLLTQSVPIPEPASGLIVISLTGLLMRRSA